MGSIINAVTARNRVFGDDLNKLSDRGIPIIQMLADEYKVSTTELSKMVSEGSVDAKHFRAALEDNLGGAALKAGDSVSGSFKNIMAAIGRLGAAFLGPSFKSLPAFMGMITDVIDRLTKRAAVVGEVVGTAFEKIGSVASEAGPTVVDALGRIVDFAREHLLPIGIRIWEIFRDAFNAVVKVIRDNEPEIRRLLTRVGEALRVIAMVALPILRLAFTEILPRILNIVIKTVDGITGAFEKMIRFFGKIEGWLGRDGRVPTRHMGSVPRLDQDQGVGDSAGHPRAVLAPTRQAGRLGP